MKRKKKTVEDLREYIVNHIKWHNAKANDWKIDGWFYLTYANTLYSSYDGEGAHFMAHAFLNDAIRFMEQDLILHFMSLEGELPELQVLILVCHLDLETERLEFREVIRGRTDDYHVLRTVC